MCSAEMPCRLWLLNGDGLHMCGGRVLEMYWPRLVDFLVATQCSGQLATFLRDFKY